MKALPTYLSKGSIVLQTDSYNLYNVTVMNFLKVIINQSKFLDFLLTAGAAVSYLTVENVSKAHDTRFIYI